MLKVNMLRSKAVVLQRVKSTVPPACRSHQPSAKRIHCCRQWMFQCLCWTILKENDYDRSFPFQLVGLWTFLVIIASCFSSNVTMTSLSFFSLPLFLSFSHPFLFLAVVRVCVCVHFVLFRSLFDPVRPFLGYCGDAFVLHGTGVGSVQQRRCCYGVENLPHL